MEMQFYIDHNWKGWGDKYIYIYIYVLVRYGNIVRLKHLGSSRYLSLSKKDSVHGFGVKVKLEGSRSSNFKIVPKYKYRREGEIVFYEDSVILENSVHKLYLNYERRNEEYVSKGELVLGSYPLGWRVKEMIKGDDEEEVIIEKGGIPLRSGSTCRLFHKELEGFITGSIKDEMYVLSEDKSPIDPIFEEFFPSTEHGELSHQRYNVHFRLNAGVRKHKTCHHPYSIFILQKEKVEDGGLITWETPLKLFHVASGLWLTVIDMKLVLSKEIDKYSFFKLIPIPSEDMTHIVTYNSYIRIQTAHMTFLTSQTLPLNHLQLNNLEMEKEHFEDSSIFDTESEIEDDELPAKSLANSNSISLSLHQRTLRRASTIYSRQYSKLLSEPTLAYKKYLSYHAKEKNINLTKNCNEIDAFSIQPIKGNIITELQTISGHKKLLLVYIY